MTSITKIAEEIAFKAHEGQTNPHDGTPYILHPVAVAQACRAKGYDDYVIAIAYLHDVVEDTSWTVEQVVNEFEEKDRDILARALKAITHWPWQDNETYLLEVKTSAIATHAKIEDMIHNFSRIPNLKDEKTKTRLTKKYTDGFKILGYSYLESI